MPTDAPLPSRLPHVLRALGHRNYRLFFVGQAISLTGLWMTRIATLWLVHRLTGSAWMLGLVAFCQHVPTFLLAPLAGTLVDRWDRRGVLVATQAASMVVSLLLAGLALGGVIEVWHVLALSAAEGAVRGFDVPARQALVVDLVEDRNDLANVIALNSTIFNGARLVGPTVGAAAIALVGEGLCFLIDGLSYTAVIAALLAMHLPRIVRTVPARHVLTELREGVVYTFGFAPHRALILNAGLVILFGAPHMALMPLFARQILGGAEGTYGLLMGASGAGALLGAVYLASRRTVRGLGRVIAGCAVAFGLSLCVFAFSPVVAVSAAVLAVAGFALMVLAAGTNTVLQTLVDDDKRGRVMSFFAMTIMGAMPLGSLVGGAAADRIGAPATVAAGGAMCLLAAGIFARRLPVLRALARPVYIERGIIPETGEGPLPSGARAR